MCLEWMELEERANYTYSHPYHKYNIFKRKIRSPQKVLKIQTPKTITSKNYYRVQSACRPGRAYRMKNISHGPFILPVIVSSPKKPIVLPTEYRGILCQKHMPPRKLEMIERLAARSSKSKRQKIP